MHAHGVRRLGVDHVVHMAQRERRAPPAAQPPGPQRPLARYPAVLLQLAGHDGQRTQGARVVVQLGGLLGRPADQPDVDERVGVEAPVPAVFGIEDDVVGAGADLRGDAASEVGEVGEPQRGGSSRPDAGTTRGVQQHGRLRAVVGNERTRKSARATALVEVVGTAGSPDLPEDRSQHALMGPQLGPDAQSLPEIEQCPRCPDSYRRAASHSRRSASGCSRPGSW